MLVSKPLSENRQMSAGEVPLAGRSSTTGLPVNAQELFAGEKVPSASTFRSTSLPGTDTPAVEGSTTTISSAVAAGAALVSEMISSEPLGAPTTSKTTLDSVPTGSCTCTVRLPAAATSAGVTGAVHSVAELHAVVRGVPPTSSTDPGPGLDAVN